LGFLLNGVRRLSPDGFDFLGRHIDLRLCRQSWWFVLALGSTEPLLRRRGGWFLWGCDIRGWFLGVQDIRWRPAHRLKLAGKILIEILSTFSDALEDVRCGQRRDKQYREENAYGF